MVLIRLRGQVIRVPCSALKAVLCVTFCSIWVLLDGKAYEISIAFIHWLISEGVQRYWGQSVDPHSLTKA